MGTGGKKVPTRQKARIVEAALRGESIRTCGCGEVIFKDTTHYVNGVCPVAWERLRKEEAKALKLCRCGHPDALHSDDEDDAPHCLGYGVETVTVGYRRVRRPSQYSYSSFRYPIHTRRYTCPCQKFQPTRKRPKPDKFAKPVTLTPSQRAAVKRARVKRTRQTAIEEDE
jgi:hypothetical protein